LAAVRAFIGHVREKQEKNKMLWLLIVLPNIKMHCYEIVTMCFTGKFELKILFRLFIFRFNDFLI